MTKETSAIQTIARESWVEAQYECLSSIRRLECLRRLCVDRDWRRIDFVNDERYVQVNRYLGKDSLLRVR